MPALHSIRSILTPRRAWAAPLLGVALAAAPQGGMAQAPLALAETVHGSAGGGATPEAAALRSTALARGNYAIVVDLDSFQLHFRRGETTLWSAKIGTGTGLRLEGENHEWDFSTPNGTFQVQYKELKPAWYKPDWFFIENSLPVPPRDAKERYQEGGLGEAALFLGHELAIHGTDKPELLGQNVSHGCIRVSNEDMLRLYHNVQVGTEVIIVGSQEPTRVVTPEEAKRVTKRARPAKGRPGMPAGWEALPTEELLGQLDEELWAATAAGTASRWPQAAILLLERSVAGDDLALDGLLLTPAQIASASTREEFVTYLADLYGRAPQRTLAGLARLTPADAAATARELAEASLRLYHGAPDDVTAPWPTRRMPRKALEDEAAREGWDVLKAAEAELRGALLARRD